VTYSLFYNNSSTADYDSSTDVDLQYDHVGCYDRFTNPGHKLVPFLTAIGLPDGTQYRFDMYNGDPQNCQQGSLTSMALPTGGGIDYAYIDFLPVGGKRTGDPPFSPGVRTRTKVPADPLSPSMTWTYVAEATNAGPVSLNVYEMRELTVTVTDPEQRQTKSYFSIARHFFTDGGGWKPAEYGLPFTHRFSLTAPTSQRTLFLSKQVMNGAAVDRSSYLQYEEDTATTNGTHQDNWREVAALVQYGGDAAGYWTSVERSQFDGVGHYRQTVMDGNFHLDSPSALQLDSNSLDKVTSFANYNPDRGIWNNDVGPNPGYSPWPAGSPWVLGTFDQQWTNIGSHTKKTELCFESATGFLSRARVLANDAASAGALTQSGADMVASYSRENDNTGNVTVEQSYGGDTTNYCTPSGTSAPLGSLCSLTLTNPRYEIHYTYQNGVRATSQPYENGVAMPLYTLDRTIDRSGAVSSERDSAGVQTTYNRDLPNNSLLITSTTTPGLANVSYQYTNASTSPLYTPAEVTVTQDDVATRVQYDSFGRLWREYRTVPTAAGSTQVQRQTLYDSAGRMTSRSMWAASGFGNVSTFSYDFLGRLLDQAGPDLQHVTAQFKGDVQRQITTKVFTSTDPAAAPSSVTTTERLDAEQRVFRLTEANGTVTSYQYGVTGALTHVCMNDLNGTCGQERTFAYDNRGFLTSENHPENGTISYTYDAGGHVLTKRPATTNTVFDLNFCYDGDGRAVRVDSRNPYYDPAHPASNPEFRNSKTFTFASANSGGNLKAGKIETAVRHNYHPTFGEITVTETYGYNDAAGRMTDRRTQIRIAADFTTIQTLDQSVSYDGLGSLSTLTYPSCVGIACGERGDTYTLRYTNGFLTSIDNYATSLAYHPSGMLNTVAHTNGVTDTYTIDANTLIPRPQSISFSSYGACAVPQITSLTQSQTVAPNAVLDLIVTANGASLTYQWHDSNGPIAGATSATYHVGPLAATHAYWVRVTNPCGTVESSRVVLTVAAAPTITTQPADATVSSGGSTQVSVVASGTTPSYQWYQGQTGVTTNPVGTNQNYFNTPALTTTTQYWVRVSNTAGTVDSRTATVTVSVPPPVPTSLNATFQAPSTIQLTWGASTGADHYEIWRRENGIGSRVVATSNVASYPDSGLSANTTYVYQVVAVGAGGSSGKSNIDLATTMQFSSVANTTITFAQFDQLRAAVNAVRAASGAASVQWVDILQGSPPPPPPAVNVVIYGEHMMALRRSMDQALAWLSIAATPYTDPTLPGSPRVVIKANHVIELRSRAQ
jgi:YD repeat-containing protein